MMRFLEYKLSRAVFPKPFCRRSIRFYFRHVIQSPLNLKIKISLSGTAFLSDYRSIAKNSGMRLSTNILSDKKQVAWENSFKRPRHT